MNSSRRWLVVFAIIIGVLAVAMVALVLSTQGKSVKLLPEDSPQGIVQRYLIAVQEKDYQTAFGYLSFSPSDKITTFNDWLPMVSYPLASGQNTWKATLGAVTQNGNYATVEVTINNIHSSGLFGASRYDILVDFQLSEINDNWLVTSPTYVYWTY